MYKLIIWKAIWTDSGPETGTDSYILNYKPTFQDMYKHLSTDMIEITKGYDKDISDRSFDMYIDEESKLKPVVVKNKKLQKHGMIGKNVQVDNVYLVILLQVM